MKQLRCAQGEHNYAKRDIRPVLWDLVDKIARHIHPQKNDPNPQQSCANGYARDEPDDADPNEQDAPCDKCYFSITFFYIHTITKE